MKRILVTGATGQIGSELTISLRNIFGGDNVVAGGHKSKPADIIMETGPFYFIDSREISSLAKIVKDHRIDAIYHLVSLLSATAEKDPILAWDVNMKSLLNALEVAREYNCSLFFPSSIGAFGPGSPLDNTPQDTIQRPNTIYGVTKLAGELLCDYYYHKYGVDTRGVRYPGLISYTTPPGGGTTDYAVEIFHHAVQNKSYTCYIKRGTHLDMMYMPDALKAAIDLMDADPARLKHRNAYNVTAMSLAPEHIAAEIKKTIPEFNILFDIDPVRQSIAETWPNSLDDSSAREEWGWKPEYGLESMTKDMLEKISKGKYKTRQN